MHHISESELVITPDVSIYDVKPSNDSGRIETFPNKTVVVEALMGESVIFICNVFNMVSSARVSYLLNYKYIFRSYGEESVSMGL